MLSYALAIAVALSSLVLFSTAFLMSDIHRQDDFLWSGVGLFYALVLWFCARSITGAVLLGQAAAATLLVSYNWQTLKLRKAIVNPTKASEINNFSLVQAINGLLKRGKSQPQATVSSSSPKVTEQEISIPDTNSTETTSPQPDNQAGSPSVKQNKFGVLGKLFGKKNSSITNTKLDEILDEEEIEKKPENTPTKTAASPDVKPISDNTDSAANNVDTDDELTVNKVVEIKENETSTVQEKQLADTSQVTQLEEKTIVSEKTIDTSPSPETNVEPQVETSPEAAEPTPVVATDNQEEKLSVTDVDVEQKSENKPEKINEEVPNIEPDKEAEKKVSYLDSLETVEVAEVLEADPEDISANRGSDQSNIIEVTTTEINTNPDSEKIEHNQELD